MKKPRYFPSLQDFRALAARADVVPVHTDILADTETPVTAFMKIDDGGGAFLLESVEGGEKWGRYSVLGASARAVVRGRDGVVEISASGSTTTERGDPLDILRRFLRRFRPAAVEGLPRFHGGAVGYVGYDVVRHIERLPELARRDLDIYDLSFMVTDTLLVFDNVEQRIKLICNAFTADGDADEVYAAAVEKLEALRRRLREGRTREPAPAGPGGAVTSNFEKEDFIEAVEKTKRYIRSGDIIQAVISQRFETPLDVEPFDVYRALRVVNPSPYMFFMRQSGVTLVGSSPEILVRLDGDDITVRPIAGTRPRGRDEARDRELERELVADPKERAEHIMLVDLGRNDVGRVAEPGSVRVDEFMTVERYSHVMHIVSNVRGKKRADLDGFDVLRSCFPAGTLSGAPKVRAMEIIEELEPTRRGVYGGSVGYIGFDGDLDVCIAIRTMVVSGGKLYVQAGAGIVADSDPAREFDETVNKAKGLFKALKLAREELN
ncbi:MAG TPA: anthranilate synthase component I [Deltaproteobacteria bacterium]|nr:anthranilate synthase component I [Deltaproteobacteria bacterium]